jgi:hypothetical protein
MKRQQPLETFGRHTGDATDTSRPRTSGDRHPELVKPTVRPYWDGLYIPLLRR